MANKTSYKIKTSDRFGEWTVLSGPLWVVPSGKKYYTPFYTCVCSCGVEKNIQGYTLLKGLSRSCGCAWKKQTKERNPFWRGFKVIPGKYFGRVKKSAEKRGLEFNISIEDAHSIFINQNGTCSLSGIPIYFGDSKNPDTASLDRIDSGTGYNLRNIQWVHKDLNKMKNEYNQDYFIEMCGSVWNKKR